MFVVGFSDRSSSRLLGWKSRREEEVDILFGTVWGVLMLVQMYQT